ncbi:MAG: hypothetical protein NC201_00600 [Prevotella sp.]|nr:hypothetical protein [Bacteroides sp.]MCM1365727.1 hypothetical protein [Prevotella sp.]MCM1436397.1 hypothetical protein [Prevotella sp.]
MELADKIFEGKIKTAEARELSRKYPYFIYFSIMALSTCETADERMELKRRIAAHLGDTDTLLNMFGADGDIFSDFYPDIHSPNPSTEDTIDNFLNKFGGNVMTKSDPLNFAPAVDYAAILEAEEKGQSLPGGDTTADISENEKEERPSEGSALTESLARMMIRQKKYEQALEIINELYLNNSEKSVYFADQIRFLKKLIINERKRKG